MKEEAKHKQWEEDQRYMKEYAEILDKQERVRKEQVEKLKVWQVRTVM